VLAMLRLSNECEEVPEEVIEKVKKMVEIAGKFLRRVWCLFVAPGTPLMRPILQRYDQFLFLTENKDLLRKVVSTAKSSSVGDPVVTSNKLLTCSHSSQISPSLSRRTMGRRMNQRLNLWDSPRRLRHPR